MSHPEKNKDPDRILRLEHPVFFLLKVGAWLRQSGVPFEAHNALKPRSSMCCQGRPTDLRANQMSGFNCDAFGKLEGITGLMKELLAE